MIRNYLKIAWRNLLHYKVFSLINILGLAIGIACVVLILLFVQDELSYDRYHPNANRVFRVINHFHEEGHTADVSIGEHKLGPLLKLDFPEMEAVVRLGQVNPVVRVGTSAYQETRFLIADSSIFNVFGIDLLKGNPKTALTEPNTVIVSETAAQKYFGNVNPVGKVILIQDTIPLRVTGLMRNFPGNTHFHADVICSMKSERLFYGNLVFNNWGEMSVYTYVLLRPGVTPASVESRFPNFIRKHRDAKATEFVSYTLQPLTGIHLQSQRADLEPGGSLAMVYVFMSIALAILVVAAINYMNLATARSASRAKEVGVRKVIGADRSNLIRQFLAESVLIMGLALLFALLLIPVFLPVLNALSNKDLSANYLTHWEILLGSLVFAILIGVGAGSYPAFFLSTFQPLSVLNGNFSRGAASAWLRKGFVVLQFGISIALVAGMLIIGRQLNYLRNKQLGFQVEQIVNLPSPVGQSLTQYEALENELRAVPGVRAVSISSKRLLGQLTSNLGFKAEGLSPEQTQNGIQVVVVDHDFFSTIGARMAEGREFSKQFPTDAESGFILNEAAVKAFGWKSAVGKSFETQTLSSSYEWTPKKGRVVGVVKDFHYEPLFNKIAPVVFYIDPNWGGTLAIRISGQHIPQTVEGIKLVWSRFAANRPFEPTFLDERLKLLYRSQEQFGQLIGYFSGLAILIACLGLYGLATFTAQQRTKEIGVRKVLGASVSSIVALLSRDFIKLVGVALLIASPLAWYAMSQWLESFAYKIDIEWWMFALAGLLAAGIALLTVSFQSVKAALVNPVKSLRSE